MSEGEFKNRIFSVMESEYQLHKTEESLRRSYTNTLGEFQRIMDEAAKDFPFPIYEKGKLKGVRLTMEQEKDMNTTMYFLACWFLKWFGKVNREETPPT